MMRKKLLLNLSKKRKSARGSAVKKLVLYSSLQVATFGIESRTDGGNLKNGWRLDGWRLEDRWKMDKMFDKSLLCKKWYLLTYVHAALIFLNYACNRTTFDNVGIFADIVKAYYNSSQKRRWTESWRFAPLMLRASFRLVYTAFVAKLASVGLVPICLGIDTGMNTGLSLSPQSRPQGPALYFKNKAMLWKH